MLLWATPTTLSSSTSTHNPTASAGSALSSPALATDAIAGIVIGAVFGLGLLFFLIYLRLRKRRNSNLTRRWNNSAELYSNEVHQSAIKETTVRGGGDGRVYAFTVPVEMSAEDRGGGVYMVKEVLSPRKGSRVKVG